MLLTGAEIFIECLTEQGVDTIFGYPGGQAIILYDALYRHPHTIKHILTSHEQGASHAADGYARATGKVGVCLATSGPGATNLVTGIATAYMDSVPMVAFTGQVPTSALGRDSFQEVDIAGITMPVTKHNFIVKDVKELAHTIRRAFAIAREGRPGPVLVDICKDVQVGQYEYTPMEEMVVYERPHPLKVKTDDLAQAVHMIHQAKHPMIIAGGGIIASNTSELLKTFAEKRNIPVANTFMGLGGFPGTHPLFTGMVGMHGTKTSNMAVSHSDLLINIGARFSDRVVGDMTKFAKNAHILHIDIDPAEIGKNICVDLSLVGDIEKILSYLVENIEATPNEAWCTQIDAWKKEFPIKDHTKGNLKPKELIEKMYEITNGEAIITTEVGQHQIWAAQFYPFNTPRSFLSSGGLGTMGFGFGAAMGAKLAYPNKTVINVAGDGSFRMNCNELATAVAYNIPLIIVLLNNRVLGMVRQWQTMLFNGRYSQTNIDRGTDFVKLAEAYGAKGYRAKDLGEFEAALKTALTDGVPVVIDCEIDCDERVLPFVPPGASLADSIMD